VSRARLLSERRDLEATFDHLEDRLIVNQARVRFWREMRERHDVVSVGETRELTSEYFAISVERRLTHPCVLAITQSARHGIFSAPAA